MLKEPSWNAVVAIADVSRVVLTPELSDPVQVPNPHAKPQAYLRLGASLRTMQTSQMFIKHLARHARSALTSQGGILESPLLMQLSARGLASSSTGSKDTSGEAHKVAQPMMDLRQRTQDSGVQGSGAEGGHAGRI